MGGARSRWVSPKLLASIASSPAEYFDYAVDDRGAPRRELWVDYVSVTGDGFNPTYAVASAIASDRLVLADPEGHEFCVVTE